MRYAMKTEMFEYFGHNVKVAYELEDGSIDIVDWAFESEDILDELNLCDGRARWLFESELVQMVSDYEEQQKGDSRRLRAYLRAKARRHNQLS